MYYKDSEYGLEGFVCQDQILFIYLFIFRLSLKCNKVA